MVSKNFTDLGKRLNKAIPHLNHIHFQGVKLKYKIIGELRFTEANCMRSDQIKKGTEKAPHRALLKSLGLEDDDIAKPLIGIANSYTNIVPGHIHLRTIGEAVKEGILAAGGTPFEFSTIAVCDGIAMGHEGMRYSLPSREIIADSVEIMLQAHSLDGLGYDFEL